MKSMSWYGTRVNQQVQTGTVPLGAGTVIRLTERLNLGPNRSGSVAGDFLQPILLSGFETAISYQVCASPDNSSSKESLGEDK